MKKVIGVLVVTLIFNLAFSQDFKGKVTYEATIISDNSFAGNGIFVVYDQDVVMPDGFKDLEVKSGKDAVPINFNLLVNKNETLYKSEYDIEETKKRGLLMNQTNLLGKQSQIYYTNSKTDEKILQSYWTKHILVSFDDIEWQLINETKEIGVHTAYKAIAIINTEQTYGMNHLSPVEAWYTPQIPLNIGIQNFNGLPGLTLELIVHYEEGKIRYLATEIDLDSDVDIQIEKPKGKEVISEQKYVKLIKELNSKRKSG